MQIPNLLQYNKELVPHIETASCYWWGKGKYTNLIFKKIPALLGVNSCEDTFSFSGR